MLVTTTLVSLLLTAVSAAPSVNTTSLIACPDTSSAEYDYVIVGAGAGGGPLAARLALKGFKVLIVEAGKDYVTTNTTVPLYLARATEDPEISLDYYVKHEANATEDVWYPRSQGIGGSTIHNALINLIPHKFDFESISKMFNDPSWSSSNMFKYWTKIENNLYLPSLVGKPLGRGYDGWLSTQMPPLNLVTDLDKIDLQLTSVLASIQTAVLPVAMADWNHPINDNIDGAGAVILTRNSNLTRSSIRDHLVATKNLYPQRLVFRTETLATKVLLCRNLQGRAQAYGVETTSGAYLLPVQAKFAGPKSNLVKTQITPKYEVILSAGTFQTPQLLMLSGIGEPAQLSQFGITTVVTSTGVGINLQDRLEMTTVWKLKQDHKIYDGCTFGSNPETDPCLKTWQEQGRNNLYSAGPAIWAHSYKSDPSLKTLDVWSMWGPGTFMGYKRGWAQALADTHNAFINVILKGHTSSKGWVRLTGPDVQDELEINKNQFTDAAGLKDLDITVAAVKKSRAFPSQNIGMGLWTTEEVWPGPSVKTDEQLKAFIRKNAWGHHACCTAKMGPDSDVNAVLDNNFKVKGVDNLRVVDNSVWPDIPGFFVTTPIYMISEKAADAVIEYAGVKGWSPSG